jgi:hypothetical protein
VRDAAGKTDNELLALLLSWYKIVKSTKRFDYVCAIDHFDLLFIGESEST